MRHPAQLLALLVVALLVPEGGCNDPLTVSIPDIVPPGQLNDSAALTTVVHAGVIGDFAIAYTGDHPDGSGGTGEGVILYGGLLADEFVNSETFPTRIEVDSRNIQIPAGSGTTTNSDVDLWYRLLHRARQSAENAAGRYATFAPTGDPGYPEMLDLAGFTYIFFAETYCSGVPVSHLDSTGTIHYGQPLNTTQLLDTAIARFDSALKVSTDAGMTNFANVGKARALLDLGQFASASGAAAGVPTDFAYIEEHATTSVRENNGVYNAGATDGRYSLSSAVDSSPEGINGFPFLSVVDPRTPFQLDPGVVGFDGSTRLWDNLRYGGQSSPITVATGAEARLIEAEAFLQAGDTVNFLARLNDLRANPAERSYFDPNPTGPGAIGVLPALANSDITNAGGAVNLLFAERARWLWLTAHRLGDLRRLLRQYGRSQSAVFPMGAYFKGGSYGVDVSIPVPITERNNPNFTRCLDTSQ